MNPSRVSNWALLLFGMTSNVLPMAQTIASTRAGIAMAIRNYTVIGGLSELEQCAIADASDSSVTRRSSRGPTTTSISEEDLSQQVTSMEAANRLGRQDVFERLGKDRQFSCQTRNRVIYW